MCASRVVTTLGLYLNAAKRVCTYVFTYIHTYLHTYIKHDCNPRFAYSCGPRPYMTQTANKFAIYTPEYTNTVSEKCTAKPREGESANHNTRKHTA